MTRQGVNQKTIYHRDLGAFRILISPVWTMKGQIKRTISIFCLLLLSLHSLSFAASTQEPVKGSAYENKTIGVRVPFPEKWSFFTDAESAPDQFKHLFENNKGQSESFLFLGRNSNGQAFSRLIVRDYEGGTIDYFDLLYAAQKDKVGIISAKYAELDDSVQWIFSTKIGQLDVIFQETITKNGNNVIRLGFWTYAPLFDKYKSSFDAITEKTGFLGKKGGREIWINVWEDLQKTIRGKDLAYVKTTEARPAPNASVECKGGKRNVLWAVKGKKNTVYLFGSIHLGKPEFYPFDPIIESSFNNSKYLVVEFDTTSKEAKNKTADFLAKARLENGKTLQDVLPANIYKRLAEYMDGMGLPMDGFKNLRPWAMAAGLEVMKLQSMGYMSDFGVDRYFLEKAAEEKSILELESFEEQMNLFENIGEEKFLAYTLFSLNSLEMYAGKMIKAWRCGDLATLEDITFEDDKTNFLNDTKPIYKKIFFDRNEKMTVKIREYLRGDGDYFVVVGAGHLIGNKGIVALLSKEGYVVSRL